MCILSSDPSETNESKVDRITKKQNNLTFVGQISVNNSQWKPIAIISGPMYQAPIEPYNFSKIICEFEVNLMQIIDQSMSEQLLQSPIQTIIPKQTACTFIYSHSGYGFCVHRDSIVMLHGTLVIVDESSGKIVKIYETKRTITHYCGHLKLYISPDNISLLDNKSANYHITRSI